MLRELTVENLAIIERVHLQLDEGFVALTGETGAGKSLLIDAIDLALGGRADSSLVRAGADRCRVDLAIETTPGSELEAKCDELGVSRDEGLLTVQREVSAEGRSTVRLNGKLAPVGTLRELGRLVADLHGQHEHQSLLDPDRQLDFLDGWIGPEATKARAAVATSYERVSSLKARLGRIRAGQREREQRIDLLRFQVNEIQEVSPRPGEMEELEATVGRLQNLEKISEALQSSLQALSEQEGSSVEVVSGCVREVETLERHDPELAQATEPLKQALFSLEDGVRALRTYADNLESDPQQLDVVAERLDALRKLRRKYGEDETAVLQHLQEAERELEELQADETSEEKVVAELEQAEESFAGVLAELTKLRQEKAQLFAEEVTRELRELAMDKAEFRVTLEPKPPDATGAEAAMFDFTANAGEPLRPLHRVASGGELSRIMLAIKVVGAGRAGVPTLIFDEVDAGLSGRAAAVVAKKLQELSRSRQVLVISHLPQIAGAAHAHHHIDKREEHGRVKTSVTRLQDEERVSEMARMLAGEKVGESALANARDLLKAHP
jgi:DNA repair protein RecN (Recombination protein N)